MKKLKKSAIIWIIVATVVAIGSIFALTNRKIVENVKRETAKLFVYEYIPNQNVNLDSCVVSRQKDSIYQDFRTQYRFHYQTIGLANFADSSHGSRSVHFINLSGSPLSEGLLWLSRRRPIWKQ